MGKNQFITTIQRAYHRVSKLEFILFILTTTLEELFSKLQSSIITHNNRNVANFEHFTDC